MMFSKTAALTVAFAAQQALAHVQLKSPFGINSKYDPQTPEGDIDYSETSPLAADGSNYPCKGYATPEKIASLNSVATLKAGQKFHVELEGSATHEGGSCQFSLSYDQGKTWAVMASVIGGCPLDLAYDFTVPEGVPSMKKALFAWTWNNKVGNREEYMDCSVVDVQGGSSDLALPGVFRANTLGDQCVIPEGTEVSYPNPGKQVLGTIGAGGSPTQLAGCNFDEDTTVTLSTDGSTSSGGGSGGNGGGSGGNGGGSSSSSAPAVTPTATVTKGSGAGGVGVGGGSTVTSSAPAVTPTSTGTSGGNTGTGGGAGAGSGASSYIKCTGKDTWSLCSAATNECTPMGAVAPGTYCDDSSSSMLAVGQKLKMARKVRRSPKTAHGKKTRRSAHRA